MFKIAHLISLIHPDLLVATFDSEINGQILIRTQFGRPRLTVAGVPQSGGIVQDILKKALNNFHQPQNFLLLGLGGGVILHEVHHRWPDCQITAVEIDPVMVTIAQNYFKVDQIPHLQIITQDAHHYVETMKHRNVETFFDSILVDCYVGDLVPPHLESPKFLRNLKHLVTPQGTIAFNRLNDKKNALKTQQFIKHLQTVFSQISFKPVYCNIIITAQL